MEKDVMNGAQLAFVNWMKKYNFMPVEQHLRKQNAVGWIQSSELVEIFLEQRPCLRHRENELYDLKGPWKQVIERTDRKEPPWGDMDVCREIPKL